MNAIRMPTGQRLEPFGDTPGELLILGKPLKFLQEELLKEAGFQLVETPPPLPYLVFTDRCWFTAAFLKQLKSCSGVGRITLKNPLYIKNNGSLQSDPARPELAIVPGGQPPGLQGPDLELELELREQEGFALHPAFAHAASGPLAIGPAMVHGLEHWTHLLRVNLLAMLAKGEQYRLEWKEAPFYKKLLFVLRLLWKAKGLSLEKLARGVSRIGKNCRIHSTAVIEASELGDEVEVGPYAMVRGSVVGSGAKIEPYGHVSLSVLGEKARVGDGAMINLCVLLPGAFVSRGDGFQMGLFGKDAFVATGATMLDLSFGRSIRVDHQGARVDTGSYFLGACVGHRAKIGNGARLSYGAVLPNDAFIVGSGEDLLKSWPSEHGLGPCRVVDGKVVGVLDKRQSVGEQ
jgi:carbonic anhydrase/acetyltransferase-like protein (isoleucine patch superfamily)